MKQYVQNDIKVKVEMPVDDKNTENKVKTESQQTMKKEVHLLYE